MTKPAPRKDRLHFLVFIKHLSTKTFHIMRNCVSFSTFVLLFLHSVIYKILTLLFRLFSLLFQHAVFFQPLLGLFARAAFVVADKQVHDLTLRLQDGRKARPPP